MRRFGRLAALALALLGTTQALQAQGGGPGGPGRGGAAMGASLERPLAGVEGITTPQRDSLTKIEAAYKPRFEEATAAIRDMMMAARQNGQMPDMAEMGKARDAMRAMRKEQLTAARAVLTDAQKPKFDDNVKAMEEEQARREEQMRQRMGGQPPR